MNRDPLTAKEQAATANRGCAADCTADTTSEIERTPERRRNHTALYGEGGFASWDRTLANARPEHRLSILGNALAELYPLARRASVDLIEISDWATNVGELYNIADTDQLQEIIVAAAQRSPQSDDLVFEPPAPPRLSSLTLAEFLDLSV